MTDQSDGNIGRERPNRRIRPTRRREATEWFTALVKEALEELPRSFLSKLSNVAVDVEWAPGEDVLREMGVDGGAVLFGTYQGVPLPERSVEYPPLYPDRIVIYERPIVEFFRTEDEIKDQVVKTVRHELGHYFGLSDDEMVY